MSRYAPCGRERHETDTLLSGVGKREAVSDGVGQPRKISTSRFAASTVNIFIGKVAAHWIRFKGTHFPVRREETVIGRSAYCTIVLSNELASRQHCALKADNEGLVINDLGSRNGTFVNGERVNGSRGLHPGDLIKVGTDLLEVLDSDVQSRKASTQTSRAQTGRLDTFEDGTTRTNVDLLEFIEGLSNAAGSFPTDPTATAIEHSLASLLKRHREQSEPLTGSQRTRVLAVISRVESWFPNGDRKPWANRMRAQLDEIGEE